MDFQHVTTWIFDLDHTLYAPEVQLFAQIERRMTDYVMRSLGLPEAEASRLREQYWREHGTTLAGLMAEHDIEPMAYLRDVHDIDFTALRPDPELAALIRALPGRKIVHTNADSTYAARVLEHRGLTVFDAIHGVENVGFHPKPDARAYAAVRAAEGFDPAHAAMFEDDPRNLLVPHGLGMQTILVGNGRTGPDAPDPDLAQQRHIRHRTLDLNGFLRDLSLNGATI
jgi:putative hydrolase of the HAD superfamily